MLKKISQQPDANALIPLLKKIEEATELLAKKFVKYRAGAYGVERADVEQAASTLEAVLDNETATASLVAQNIMERANNVLTTALHIPNSNLQPVR